MPSSVGHGYDSIICVSEIDTMALLFDSEFSTILKIRKKAYWDLGLALGGISGVF